MKQGKILLNSELYVAHVENGYLWFNNEIEFFRINLLTHELDYFPKISEQIDVIGKYNELTNFIFDREFNEITSKLETQLFISKNSINSYPRVKQGIKKAVTIVRNFMPPIFSLFLRLILPPIIIKTLSKVR